MESGNPNHQETIDVPFDREQFHLDPYPFFRELRSRAPFYKFYGQWLVSRHADVTSLLSGSRFAYPHGPSEVNAQGRDWASMVSESSSSNLIGRVRQKCAELSRLWIFGRNPPDHTRLRGLLRPPFTRDKILALSPRVQAIADRLLENHQGAAKFDVVSRLAFPLTLQVITEILGVPANATLMRRWGQDMSASLAANHEPLDDERGLVAIAGMAEYLRKTTPDNETMLASLREASARGELSSDEVLGNAAAILVAGHITTRNQSLPAFTCSSNIRSSFDCCARIRPYCTSSRRDPSLRSAVAPRTKSRNERCRNGGITIRKGDSVILLLASANRDPDFVSDPESFDITREPSQHLSFGFGLHFCMGRRWREWRPRSRCGAWCSTFPRLRLRVGSAAMGKALGFP